MNQKHSLSRRQALKIGGAAIAAIPLIVLSSKAMAAQNASMRTTMKYQDKPEGDKSCAGCVQFVPGKSATDLGGCKIFPGDTEVSAKGYCVAWAKKA